LGSGGIPYALPVYQYSQQQHTVFTSTHSLLSPVDSLDVLRVTVLLRVQSDAHRRLWNREGQWEKLSTGRGVPHFEVHVNICNTKSNSNINANEKEANTVQITRDQLC
jgi:hypothetical protein